MPSDLSGVTGQAHGTKTIFRLLIPSYLLLRQPKITPEDGRLRSQRDRIGVALYRVFEPSQGAKRTAEVCVGLRKREVCGECGFI